MLELEDLSFWPMQKGWGKQEPSTRTLCRGRGRWWQRVESNLGRRLCRLKVAAKEVKGREGEKALSFHNFTHYQSPPGKRESGASRSRGRCVFRVRATRAGVAVACLGG